MKCEKNVRILEVNNISCELHYPLFRDLSFTLHAGQSLYVQGANGSGKTTLLRCLLGLFPVSQGGIHWHGIPLSKAQLLIAEHVFYQACELAIKLDLSCRENLMFWLRSTMNAHQAHGDVAQLRALVDQSLEAMNLLTVADLPSRLLSGGQQRRLALSRLQLSAASLWILDEPFAAVDALGIALLQTMLNRHVLAGGSLIITSHQPLTLDVAMQEIVL